MLKNRDHPDKLMCSATQRNKPLSVFRSSHSTNIPVFVDHAGLNDHQSVRNLAGTLHMPTWNDLEHGIQLKLKPAGPASEILLQLRDAARTEPAIMQTVGFSSVVNVQLNKNREVTKIVRVRSTDVVIDPARGGKFLSTIEGAEHVLPGTAESDPDPNFTGHTQPPRYTKNPKEASGVKGGEHHG